MPQEFEDQNQIDSDIALSLVGLSVVEKVSLGFIGFLTRDRHLSNSVFSKMIRERHMVQKL